MLDYFNTRQYDKQKSPITRKPHITFGISIQTPREFQKPFTMFSKGTFVNPYLSYQKNRKTIIPIDKLIDVNPLWTKKVDINQIQTQRTFIKNNHQFATLDPKGRYYKELSTSKTRFRLTKGQFSNFLVRNHSKSLFGPLIGKQRDSKRSLLTKNQIARKSYYKLSQNFQKLQNYSKKQSIKKQPFCQKHLLQKTRFAFRQGLKKQLQTRKTKNADLYVLPQLNKSYSNMKYNIDNDSDQQNPQYSLLSNKSIEKLTDLRDFNYTQKYFTLDVKSKKHLKDQNERKQ